MAISSFSETFESGSWKSKAELFYPLQSKEGFLQVINQIDQKGICFINFYMYQKFGLDSKLLDLSFNFDCSNKTSYKNERINVKLQFEKTVICTTQISIQKIDESNFPLHLDKKYPYAKFQGYMKSKKCNFEIYFDVTHSFFNFNDFLVLVFYIILIVAVALLIGSSYVFSEKDDFLSPFTIIIYLVGDIMQICYFSKVLYWQQTIISMLFLMLLYILFFFKTFILMIQSNMQKTWLLDKKSTFLVLVFLLFSFFYLLQQDFLDSKTLIFVCCSYSFLQFILNQNSQEEAFSIQRNILSICQVLLIVMLKTIYVQFMPLTRDLNFAVELTMWAIFPLTFIYFVLLCFKIKELGISQFVVRFIIKLIEKTRKNILWYIDSLGLPDRIIRQIKENKINLSVKCFVCKRLQQIQFIDHNNTQILYHQEIITTCSHIFHKECIRGSLEHQNNCPICRENLTQLKDALKIVETLHTDNH